MPTSPTCLVCPLAGHCEARAADSIERYPVKTKKVKQRDETTLVAAVEHRGRLYLVRESERLLGGLWGLPRVVANGDAEIATLSSHLRDAHGINASELEYTGEARHVFTHIRMRYRLYRTRLEKKPRASAEARWVTRLEIDDLGLSKAMRKVLALLDE